MANAHESRCPFLPVSSETGCPGRRELILNFNCIEDFLVGPIEVTFENVNQRNSRILNLQRKNF